MRGARALLSMDMDSEVAPVRTPARAGAKADAEAQSAENATIFEACMVMQGVSPARDRFLPYEGNFGTVHTYMEWKLVINKVLTKI